MKQITCSINQPYFFPYFGYFLLLAESDVFISLDDVNMRKKGYIHRNYYVHEKEKRAFTIPIKKISQNKTINETHALAVKSFAIDFFRLMEESYKHCSYYYQLQSILEELIEQDDSNISKIAIKSVMIICERLKIKTIFLNSSKIETHESVGHSRIIFLCKSVGATSYVNLPSGRDLYQPDPFREAHIDLRFLSIDWDFYAPFLHTDGSPVSILDTIARFSFDDVASKLYQQTRGRNHV